MKHDSNAQRVMAVIRIGPLTASAAVATVGDAHLFKNGRQFAAWLGTMPKQASSGGKTRLGRITKQGNTYLRTLLFQGARSAVTSAHRRTDRLSRWIVQLQARVGWYRTLVAVANKHARIRTPPPHDACHEYTPARAKDQHYERNGGAHRVERECA
ncbi:transposase [Paraburkholderia sp. SIMBA_054]|uniref:transposase n=1 Tax=Paraburkholderia sp. SIMBA_054 TaxID=3085795 RepID=UPI00397D606D